VNKHLQGKQTIVLSSSKMVVYQPKKESLAKPVVGASKKVPPVKHRGFNKEA
jgi:hypothetical protein